MSFKRRCDERNVPIDWTRKLKEFIIRNLVMGECLHGAQRIRCVTQHHRCRGSQMPGTQIRSREQPSDEIVSCQARLHAVSSIGSPTAAANYRHVCSCRTHSDTVLPSKHLSCCLLSFGESHFMKLSPTSPCSKAFIVKRWSVRGTSIYVRRNDL